jgi:hypothetical protein
MHAFTTLWAGGLVAISLGWAAQAEGLCRADETVMFACTTAKGMAYVCTSKPFTATAGTLQYRFGQPGHVDLAYPATPDRPAGHFHFSSTAYSGGGEAHLAFSNDGYDYLLYDRTIAGDWDKQGHRPHAFSTGVLVRKGRRIVSNRRCLKADDSMRQSAYEDLPSEDFDYDAVPAAP